MATSEHIDTTIPGQITMLAAPSLPFVKLLYIINGIGTVANRFFYIDNTDTAEPFLAYDSDPVDDIYVQFKNCPQFGGNYANINGTYHITNKGTILTCAFGLFRENGSANIHCATGIIKHNLGTMILYESQGKRRIYVKINWNGTFFEQWKRLSIYDEFNI